MIGYTYRELGQHGRLGNQLWQIASTYGIAHREYKPCVFPWWHYASWFNVPECLFVRDFSECEDLYPDYLQDLSYLSGVESEIREWFAPSRWASHRIDIMYPDVDFEDITAIHVRRGDYLGLPNHHPVCPIEYYDVALQTVGADKIMVFTDDQGWCRGQPLFANAIIADGSEVEDLHTMVRCAKHIISNSTFSWWGAWLANGDPRNVAYPERWYGPEVRADYRLMVEGLGWNGIEFPDFWGIG